MWDYWRRQASRKYPERFIQGLDYKRIDHPKYKYEMLRDRAVLTRHVGRRVYEDFFSLNEYGLKIIKQGYRSDGPSGLTIDTPSFMRGSFSHDVDWQIAREGLIPDRSRDMFFDVSNDDLRRVCIVDGMMWPRYHWVYAAVGTDIAKENFKKVMRK